MKKILFLPFLTIPTGHHSVANTLISSLKKRIQGEFASIDFLSYFSPRLERAVTNLYLNWISYSPETYNWAYSYFVYPSSSKKYTQVYERLFLTKMQRLLSEEQPDLIICTQAYPSLLISCLKVQGKIKTPVINVYTDLFINNIWGRMGIDYHFVADVPLKNELVQKYRVPKHQVFITGIPVDEWLAPTTRQPKLFPPYHILIAGGNSGLGNINELLQTLKNSTNFNCTVLCGNNKRLLAKIISWQIKNIYPLPYISSKREMALLYDQVDAIVTKPGGVTISEALRKRIPIFVYSALPGQEQFNQQYLTTQGLVYPLTQEPSAQEQLLSILSDKFKQANWRKRVDSYFDRLERSACEKIVEISDQIT
ncbi:MGDG synthase family glycosyltransferase [Desulfosporosinus nitroreducens]|uniref:Galactosyldiacylglycerol synthase n=1 Tax=Desulfosporosinus nitroreducens TaxID=2018668 RepID=A0ABT8QS81_9FIRM|nr:galactosyldiacylglycerol synthase [Desulfosporosinus nitroreducens]MDO0823515.1 galactosyldiacylglycerol synthase [Desulfosporosinus nitroreducens]